MNEALEELIETVLKPLVAADGGLLTLIDVSDDEVVFGLGSACAGCPGAPYTQGRVIEPLVRSLVGETIRIRFETVMPDIVETRGP